MRTRALRRPTNPAVLQYFLLAASALLTSSLASPAGIVDRAEATELRLSDGKLQPRVVRDEEGHIISLTLSDMKLSSDEVAELGTLEHLSSLVLFRTNFTDADLAH